MLLIFIYSIINISNALIDGSTITNNNSTIVDLSRDKAFTCFVNSNSQQNQTDYKLVTLILPNFRNYHFFDTFVLEPDVTTIPSEDFNVMLSLLAQHPQYNLYPYFSGFRLTVEDIYIPLTPEWENNHNYRAYLIIDRNQIHTCTRTTSIDRISEQNTDSVTIDIGGMSFLIGLKNRNVSSVKSAYLRNDNGNIHKEFNQCFEVIPNRCVLKGDICVGRYEHIIRNITVHRHLDSVFRNPVNLLQKSSFMKDQMDNFTIESR